MNTRYYVIPYTELDDGDWTISDDGIVTVWADLIKHNRVKTLFYTGKVTNEIEFIDWLQDPGNVVIFVADALKQDFAVLSWTNGYFPPGGCLIHYAALGNFRMGAIKVGLQWWKDAKYPGSDEHILKVLLALTPGTNQTTRKLMKHLGFQTMEVPNLIHLAYENRVVPGIFGALNLR